MANRKRWAVLVWLAGDNDLAKWARGDLEEMKTTASTADVHVVAELDTYHAKLTRRYYLRRGTSLEEDVVATLNDRNTGDPRVAIDFFTWAMEKYQADHYLAVLWNHGSGIDEEGLEAVRRRRGVKRPALFTRAPEPGVSTMALAHDDTAKDFLDNAELKRVLQAVTAEAGRPLDVLGLDACLMNMIEIAYQLRGTAGLLVGSEEVEPNDGWPYDKILATLADTPDMTPLELSRVIVDRYVKSYRREVTTLSALDLARVGHAAAAVDELAGALLKAVADPTEHTTVWRAIKRAQRYDTRSFVDLVDLCGQVATATRDGNVRAAAHSVVRAVLDGGFVAAEGHRGKRIARSHGVSIYVPYGDATVVYGKLDFARETRWGRFITTQKPRP